MAKKVAEPKYRPLEKEFDKNGFHYTLVKREGLVAIYEQKHEADGATFIAYEVFEIIQKDEEYVGPKKYYQPPRELQPNTESFGLKGFSCNHMERAEFRFKQLQELIANRHTKTDATKKSTKRV